MPREEILPQLWVLTGPKAGDNAQVLRAAAASGLEAVVRNIVIRPDRMAAKPGIGPSLDHVDVAASDPLEGPWPEVVLAIGRHLSCVALWIKAKSGGKTRIALLNAPKGRWNDFDLVVLPPYYRNRDRANVLPIAMPLIGLDADRLAAARDLFGPVLSALPRPLNVLLVGGDMGQRKLRPGFVRQVLERMIGGYAATGTIYAATSRRTPPSVVEALKVSLRPQDRLYAWGAAGSENPYLGLLALADSFTVTADSLSMLIEVARLGRPLTIAEPPPPGGLAGLRQRASDLLRPRDLASAIAALYRGGHAVPLGMEPRIPASPLPDDAAIVGQRLRQLAGVKS
jgi:mitochondrial fission protein ELM1